MNKLKQKEYAKSQPLANVTSGKGLTITPAARYYLQVEDFQSTVTVTLHSSPEPKAEAIAEFQIDSEILRKMFLLELMVDFEAIFRIKRGDEELGNQILSRMLALAAKLHLTVGKQTYPTIQATLTVAGTRHRATLKSTYVHNL